jgi:ribosomal protein S18 acetylase RimI-like enzyme
LAIAHQQAAERNIQQLSLLCFEQNIGALRFYQRNGFQEIDRAKVVPHPLIHHTGDILLMTAPVQA